MKTIQIATNFLICWILSFAIICLASAIGEMSEYELDLRQWLLVAISICLFAWPIICLVRDLDD